MPTEGRLNLPGLRDDPKEFSMDHRARVWTFERGLAEANELLGIEHRPRLLLARPSGWALSYGQQRLRGRPSTQG